MSSASAPVSSSMISRSRTCSVRLPRMMRAIRATPSAASGVPSRLITDTTKVPAAADTDSPAGRRRTVSSSAARIGGSASKTRPSLTGKWLKTVFSTTPACLAISITVTASKPRSANSSVAASTIRARVSCRFPSRLPGARRPAAGGATAGAGRAGDGGTTGGTAAGAGRGSVGSGRTTASPTCGSGSCGAGRVADSAAPEVSLVRVATRATPVTTATLATVAGRSGADGGHRGTGVSVRLRVSHTLRDRKIASARRTAGPWSRRGTMQAMRIGTLRRSRGSDAESGTAGTARLDRRTKTLTKRLRPGDIAVIDHVDIDRVSADSLVACQVGAVVNAAPSISGRYPNLGPEILVSAGIPLIDGVGQDVFGKPKEGTQVRLDGNRRLAEGGTVFSEGTRQDDASIAASMTEARAGLSTQLEAFAANTMEYMKRERALLLDGVGVPDVTTRIEGRHALIVVRGYDYKEDLGALRSYIRDYRPVLIGVDGGADALREAGYQPDMIIGDMDSVSDDVLRCGAEVVVHAYADGRAPGLARVQDLGVEAITFPAAATSEDIAMLLADEKGAKLIVAVGTHATLVEFLDKGRGGMASTFLTRLRLGGKLVDAKGVSRLYRSRISTTALIVLVLAAFVAIGSALWVSTAGRVYLDLLVDQWNSFVFWLENLFS